MTASKIWSFTGCLLATVNAVNLSLVRPILQEVTSFMLGSVLTLLVPLLSTTMRPK